MNNPVIRIEDLPFTHQSPDVFGHDHVLEVVQEMLCCTKAQSVEITVFALANDCTIVQALYRLYGKTAGQMVVAAIGI